MEPSPTHYSSLNKGVFPTALKGGVVNSTILDCYSKLLIAAKPKLELNRTTIKDVQHIGLFYFLGYFSL